MELEIDCKRAEMGLNTRIHATLCSFHFIGNLTIFGFLILKHKRKLLEKDASTENAPNKRKRNHVLVLNYVFLFSFTIGYTLIDEFFLASPMWTSFQAWLCAFSMCLLDYRLAPQKPICAFGNTLKGWAAWTGTSLLGIYALHHFIGQGKEFLFNPVNIISQVLPQRRVASWMNLLFLFFKVLAIEWGRLILWFTLAGFATDLFFPLCIV